MSSETIGVIGCLVMLVLLFLRVWVGPSMMIVSIVGISVIKSWKYCMFLIGGISYSEIASYTWACLPLFVLMGCVLSVSGIGGDLYSCARAFLSKVRGGLAMATVVACGVFAAICGDSVATAVTMGKVSLPEMKKYNYNEGFAASSIVAGGTIGIMIPPSVSFIMYAMITEQSVGKLFAAGMVPGITQVIFYMITIAITCKLKPGLSGATFSLTRQQRLKTIIPVWPVVVIFIVMMGGLYGGFFTPVEAGAFGAFTAFILGFALRRFSKEKISAALKDTVQSTSMVFFLIVGAYFFVRFMSVSSLPNSITESLMTWQQANDIPGIVIIIVLVLFYLVTGCFLDCLATILLTLPIAYPIVVALGYDPIWWGVIMVRVMEDSMITPPFGLNLFSVSRACNVPIGKVYKGIWPFIISDVCHITLLIAFPGISLWLPRLMGLMQ